MRTPLIPVLSLAAMVLAGPVLAQRITADLEGSAQGRSGRAAPGCVRLGAERRDGIRAGHRHRLASSSARCTVAYWHHPLYSSGPSGGSPRMRGIWRMLYDAGADVVLSGHDHLYERFAPPDADGSPDARRGIRQFIVGTGGAALYQVGPARPNSETRRRAGRSI